ncbi:unnamed protein product, partial [Meganyctiphanes norvegica]
MFAVRTSKMLLAAAILVILQVIGTSNGDLEAVLGRCCLLGNNWARQKRLCATFPGPVPDLAAEQQSVCLTSASVCCLRYYREQQCSQGRSAAQTGLDCLRRAQEGGEYFKDCCDGCKLGLMSGSMGMPCTFTAFQFGYPWDTAYTTCCTQAASVVVTEGGGSGSFTSTPGIQTTNGITSITDTIAPSGGDLCAMFPGELCSQECISTDKSYRCACRSGFTLSQDQKTCLQDQQTDRCLVNNPCAHICQDTGISVECSCNPGFQLAQDQRSCKDVDECAEGSDSCDWSSQSCVNSVGSFRCIDREPDCNFGYRFDTEKRACVGFARCSEAKHAAPPGERMVVSFICNRMARAIRDDLVVSQCHAIVGFDVAIRLNPHGTECPCELHRAAPMQQCNGRPPHPLDMGNYATRPSAHEQLLSSQFSTESVVGRCQSGYRFNWRKEGHVLPHQNFITNEE